MLDAVDAGGQRVLEAPASECACASDGQAVLVRGIETSVTQVVGV